MEDSFLEERHLSANIIRENHIIDNVITGAKVRNNAIEGKHIAINSIDDRHIMNMSIKGNKILDGSISENKIVDESISTNKLKDKSITNDKIRLPFIKISSDPVFTCTQVVNLGETFNLGLNQNYMIPKIREGVAEFLTKHYRSYFPVGRLDWNSTGLMILTNDGEIAERLMHPKFGFERIYQARVEGTVSEETLAKISRGVKLSDGMVRASATIVRNQGESTWVEVEIREGRNRVVRRLFDKLGHPVSSLQVSQGVIKAPGGAQLRYGDILVGQALEREATGQVPLKPASEHRYIGRPVQRPDIHDKVMGKSIFVQEMRMPGMVYGQVVRPPTYGATLKTLPTAAVERMPGVIKVVRNGSFVGVVAQRIEQAQAAAQALAQVATWEVPRALPKQADLATWLRQAPSRLI
ncbi:MAG: pseudouridine synthase, partial [Betaproteobacteria bacterium]|nr:pseudouridine synthase [Betaproteobacteria bacterium]